MTIATRCAVSGAISNVLISNLHFSLLARWFAHHIKLTRMRNVNSNNRLAIPRQGDRRRQLPLRTQSFDSDGIKEPAPIQRLRIATTHPGQRETSPVAARMSVWPPKPEVKNWLPFCAPNNLYESAKKQAGSGHYCTPFPSLAQWRHRRILGLEPVAEVGRYNHGFIDRLVRIANTHSNYLYEYVI